MNSANIRGRQPGRILAALAAALLLVPAFSPARASWFDDDPPSTVLDLRYGVALYQYYQNKNLEALSELLVAEREGGISGHGDNPEIMAGGFYLAYGMNTTARGIFERLLDANRPVDTRNAAWFYLARLSYLQGDYPGAENMLGRLSGDADRTLEVEADALRFNIAVRENDLQRARGLLEDKTLRASDWVPYLYFNLGAAHSRQQQWPAASDYFARFAKMRERDPEHLALYDKAMTALGYSELFQGNHAAAIDGFRQVRLGSPLSSKALLGYGWAAYAEEDYNLALKPWQALADFRPVDASVQEAWVAIPTIYEKLGFAATALERYREAEAGYGREIERLDETLAKIDGNAIREALNIDRSYDFDWLDYAANNALTPELTYLVPLFAEDRFLRQVQTLRDLIAIQTNLREWQQKLGLYRQMIDEREANRGAELERLKARDLDATIAELVTTRHELLQTLHGYDNQPDFLATVATQFVPRRERIARAERNVERLQAAGAAADEVLSAAQLRQLAETVRIQKGLLVWHSAQQYDDRLQYARLKMVGVNQALEDIRATKARIEAILEQGYDLDPYRTRIERADTRVATRLDEVDGVIDQAQQALREQIRETLGDERRRLVHYLGQARLAIARMVDRTAQDRAAEAQHAPDEPSARESL